MEVVAVIFHAGAEHGLEALAGGREHFAQETPRVDIAEPVALHRDRAPVGEREGGDVDGVAEGVFGEALAGLVVARAAGIGRDLLERHDRRAEPGDRRGLHGFRQPALDRRRHRAAERRYRADGDGAVFHGGNVERPVDAAGAARVDGAHRLHVGRRRRPCAGSCRRALPHRATRRVFHSRRMRRRSRRARTERRR